MLGGTILNVCLLSFGGAVVLLLLIGYWITKQGQRYK